MQRLIQARVMVRAVIGYYCPTTASVKLTANVSG
jgi:hypothetical protein